MAKTISKYFLALVPVAPLQEQATALKLQLKEKFNLKYALKSPAHVTIKMPFHWNEAKEDELAQRLGTFFEAFGPIDLEFSGFDRFGKRVLFIAPQPNSALSALQSALSGFCRTTLKLEEELSDKAFHPHMTIAFKDTKPQRFDDYWSYVKAQPFQAHYQFKDIALLKKTENRWEVVRRIGLGA
jgi:2'-5' RNA ligase